MVAKWWSISSMIWASGWGWWGLDGRDWGGWDWWGGEWLPEKPDNNDSNKILWRIISYSTIASLTWTALELLLRSDNEILHHGTQAAIITMVLSASYAMFVPKKKKK